MENLFLLQGESSIYDIYCVPVILSHVRRDCIQIARYRTTVQSSAAWTSSCKKTKAGQIGVIGQKALPQPACGVVADCSDKLSFEEQI